MKTKKILAFIMSAMLSVSLLASCTSTSAGNSSEESSSTETSSTETSTGDFDTTNFISVVSREDGSGTRGAFVELLGIEEKDDNGNKVDKTTEDAIVVNKTDVMLTNVAGEDYAIGYVSLGSINDTIKVLDIDGVAATAENVKNGTYSVSRPFNIATKGEATGLAADFIEYILSAEGQAIVADSYISIDDDAASYAGSAPSGTLTISGSSSVTPVMEKLVEAYAVVNPNATIEINMTDSSSGIQGVIDGTCDIGMASRALKDSEVSEVTGISIALDGIAVIVNNNNTFSNLTSEQVRQIYTGEVETWDAVQ